MKKITLIAAILIGIAATYPVSAQSFFDPLAPAYGFNVITRQTLTAAAGQTNGPVAIGTNLTLKGNAIFAANSNGLYPTQILNDYNNYGLVVNGQISFANSNTTNLNRGFLRLADASGANIWTADPNNVSANLRITKTRNYNDNQRLELQRQQTASSVTQPHGLDFAVAFEQFAEGAAILSSYNTDSKLAPYINKITIPATANPTISLAENKVNYIYLTQDQLSRINNQGSLVFANKPSQTTPVVFNIESSSFQWTQPNIAGLSGAESPYILWNFHGATALTIKGSNPIYGTVFAPGADITKSSGSGTIYGQVVGLSLKLDGGLIDYIPFSAKLIKPSDIEESTLPLRSMELNAAFQNEQVKLTWQVSGEEQISKYVVEKSTDGQSFTAAGTVRSAGNNEQYTYRYTDIAKEENISIVYYRIKAVEDQIGKTYFSNVVAVRTTSANTSVQLWPNPVVNQLTVRYEANTPASVSVQLFDMQQKLVKQLRINAEKGVNHISMTNLENLPAGIYLLKLVDQRSGTVVSSHKMVK